MKQVEYRIYELDGTFKDTLDTTKIMSDFVYSSNINWSQGEVNIEYNAPFSDNTVIKGDFLRVFVFTDDFPDGINVYSGMINEIKRTYTKGIEKVAFTAIWLGSLLSFTYYQSAWSYAFSKSWNAHDIVKDVIDNFNTKYAWNWITYSTTSIEEKIETIDVDFNYTKSFDALKLLSEINGFDFFIDGFGVVNFKSKTSPLFWDDTGDWLDSDEGGIWVESLQESYLLTVWKNVDSLEIIEDSERVINKYILQWKSWTLAPTEDATSQGVYWIRELKESKTDIANSGTAQIYADAYIEKNKDHRRKFSVIVNNSFNIENLHPTDIISIRNTDYIINNCQIQKIDYSVDRIKLYVESFDNIGKEIFNT